MAERAKAFTFCMLSEGHEFETQLTQNSFCFFLEDD